MHPLRSKCGTPQQLIPEKVLQTIVSNLDEIVLVNKEVRAAPPLPRALTRAASPFQLLTALNKRMMPEEWESSSYSIGDIFLKLAPFLKMYSIYVSNCASHA